MSPSVSKSTSKKKPKQIITGLIRLCLFIILITMVLLKWYYFNKIKFTVFTVVCCNEHFDYTFILLIRQRSQRYYYAE